MDYEESSLKQRLYIIATIMQNFLFMLVASTTGASGAQTDPSNFGTVYNMGIVPPGSIFDIPSAIYGSSVGNGSVLVAGLVTPTFLEGDVLGSDSQLNIFSGGAISYYFHAGLVDGTGSNVEVNIFDGSVGNQFTAHSDSTVNILGGVIGFEFQAQYGSIVNVIGGYIKDGFEANSGSIVNIIGGEIAGGFQANTGSLVSISSGSGGSSFRAHDGSFVNITGGSVGRYFDAELGSTVELTGGTYGFQFETYSGSNLTLVGGEFRLNGSPVTDLSAGIGFNQSVDVFTGIMADGSVFIFAGQAGNTDDDYLRPGTTTLQQVAVPPSTTPVLLSNGIYTKGVRSGETLSVIETGELGDNFAVVGGVLNIEGGTVREGLEVAFGEINITGGSIGRYVTAFAESTLNITGGDVSNLLNAYDGSVVNISGGSIGSHLLALDGSVVNLTGGTIGEDLRASSGSDLQIYGGSFLLNGYEVADLSGGFGVRTGSDRSRDLLTGIFENGSVFIFAGEVFDNFEAGAASLHSTSVALSTTPSLLTEGTYSKGVRAGETLTVAGNGSLGKYFSVVNGTLNVEGGTVDDGMELAGSVATISGGTVGYDCRIYTGSTLNLTGGTIGGRLGAYEGSTVNVSGGEIGSHFYAYAGSVVNVSGGSIASIARANAGSTFNVTGGNIGGLFAAYENSVVNLSGGAMGSITANVLSTINISGGTAGYMHVFNAAEFNLTGGTITGGHTRRDSIFSFSGGTILYNFDADAGSITNIYGTSFQIDGVELTGLVLNEQFVVSDRNVVLTGILADGSPFEFDLDSTGHGSSDYFHRDSILTVTLVDPPAEPCLADVNGDGMLSPADFSAWINAFSTMGLACDQNSDGVCSPADFSAWVANYLAGCT